MEPDTILLVHNSYLQPGGEAQVFQAEAAMLRARGHKVVEYHRTNAELDHIHTARAGVETIWSRRTIQELSDLLLRI